MLYAGSGGCDRVTEETIKLHPAAVDVDDQDQKFSYLAASLDQGQHLASVQHCVTNEVLSPAL